MQVTSPRSRVRYELFSELGDVVWQRAGEARIVLVLGLLVNACSGETPQAVEAVPSSIVISPESATLTHIGATQQFNAKVLDQFGAELTAAVSWVSTAASVVAVQSTSGFATAVAPGSAQLRASFESVSATAYVSVAIPATSVTISAASQQSVDLFVSRVTATLVNGGGPGFYKLEFWDIPNVPNGPNRLYATSEPIDVPVGYSETLTWDVPVTSFLGKVRWILAFSRPAGSGAYAQTGRWDFPP